MQIEFYDCEVFHDDWLVVFKDKQTGNYAPNYTVFCNTPDELRDYINSDTIYVGFNSKHYDQYIIKAIVAGLSPPEVKQVNDFIMAGGQGWECPLLKDVFFSFNNVDIKDDMQMGLSLKAIEGHLGLPIQESSVAFDIDRPLTEDERTETILYCQHDVDTTEAIFNLRTDYIKNKLNLGRLAGIPDVKAMGMTNAKLTAAMLQAKKQPHDDERQYVYPDNLNREYIPQEVFDFFDKMHDDSIPDKELFSGKINLNIGECAVTIGYGGIHGAIPNFFWEQSDNPDKLLRNFDVGSYYPHLCTVNGYTSRNIPSPEIYKDVLDQRMSAKKSGDKATANALKLVCNTTYGAMLNQYNDLYDPLMGRSVCISGQLYLLELAEHLYQDIPDLQVVNYNTDGVMVLFDKSQYSKVLEITGEWQQRTHFDLEEDAVVKIAQKDVNNYIEVQENGSVKLKGGYLVRGIAPAGAFNINNNCCIVATALKEHFVNGTPAEDTINNCNGIMQFQIIAKAGVKYKEAYHMVDGKKLPVQKVNRVYATTDERYGKLYKVKAENEATAKIEMLPEHCIIDNDNQLSISDIDKHFYIEMANKRINDFKGIKPEKKTRRTRKVATANIYQKLSQIRQEFAEAGIEKNGKNMQLTSKFFTLDDIVNKSRDIFQKYGILPLDNFTVDKAELILIDIAAPDTDRITFSIPMREYLGNAAVTPVQAMGATVTYYRRYLYSLALDLAEKDELEEGFNHIAPPASKASAPATAEQRQGAKLSLTDTCSNATDLQITGLKKVLKQLKEKQPDKEELIAQIAIQTKSFTVISKEDCETLIQKITAMLDGEEKQS